MKRDYTEALEVMNELFVKCGGAGFINDRCRSRYIYDAVDEFNMMSDDIQLFCTCGATKIVIISDDWDFVLKMALSRKDEVNYCALEAANYAKAVVMEVDKMLAWTELAGRVCGVPIYAQEKVECDEDSITESLYCKSYDHWVSEGCEYDYYACEGDDDEYDLDTEEGRRDFFNDRVYYEEDNDWEGICDLFYDKYFWQDCEELNCWIEEYGINDIHAGNVGYRGSDIVIVDYSGYNREWYLHDYNYKNFKEESDND